RCLCTARRNTMADAKTKARYAGTARAIESTLGKDRVPDIDTYLAAADRLGSWDAVTAALARGENLDEGHTPSPDGQPATAAMPTTISWSLDSTEDPSAEDYGAMTLAEVNLCR